MSKLADRINDALGIDVEKVIKDAEDEVSDLDQQEIEKYNERKEIISKLKQDLKDARTLNDKTWAQALLKRSAERITLTQEIFTHEIEDDPVSKNVTAQAELANALVNTVSGVLDIEREDIKIAISKEKNDLRRLEIESQGGPIINSPSGGKVIGVGSNHDLLKLIKSGIDPTKLIDVKDKNDASS